MDGGWGKDGVSMAPLLNLIHTSPNECDCHQVSINQLCEGNHAIISPEPPEHKQSTDKS